MAFAGTVSPQLASMDPNQPAQVIVQYNPSTSGGLQSSLCGVLNFLQQLPVGDLCSMNVSNALGLAQNPAVAHISVNNPIVGAGSAVPVYDYVPRTIQPQSGGALNPNAGQNIGIAIIDSGIQIDQDLMGNGSNSLFGSLFPQVSYAESFVPGEGVNDYYGHGTHIAGIISGNGANSAGRAYL